MTTPLPVPIVVVAGTCLIGASLAYVFAPRRLTSAPAAASSSSTTTHAPHLPSALIPCYTTHARLLPTPSRHAFAYPLLYIGADIDALEQRALDEPYRVFSFGGVALRLLGLRAGAYLGHKQAEGQQHQDGEGGEGPGGNRREQSLRAKVEELVRPYDVQCGRVWLVTMPSLLGWEGINPLSVWYIYAPASDNLSAVVLEVHNTFGEKHAYVLPTSSPFTHTPKDGYTHAWTFPRGFHVSPFNSRDGLYTLDLVDPFSRSGSTGATGASPEVRVFLRLLTPSKQVKLHALLASSDRASPVPLGKGHTGAVVRTVLRWPLALLLTTPRILWHAYRLHYEKRLAVYPRPEPVGVDVAHGGLGGVEGRQEDGEWNPPHPEVGRSGRGIEWQPSSFGEKHARGLVQRYLEQKGAAVRITFSYPAAPLVYPAPKTSAVDDFMDHSTHDDYPHDHDELRIHTTDPKFFINLVLFRPVHLLVLAPELGTTVSSPSRFLSVFGDIDNGPDPSPRISTPLAQRLAQRVRNAHITHLFTHSLVPPEPAHLVSHHTLAHTSHFAASLSGWVTLLVLALAAGGEWVEEWALGVMGARFVEGREPWKVWERAAGRMYARGGRVGRMEQVGRETQGQVRDEAGDEAGRERDDDWVDLGSVRLE